jgi:hypothetical protein
MKLFGELFLEKVLNKPLGTLTKRELELSIIEAALESSLVQSNAYSIAQKFRVSLPKAHAYLTDIALRGDELTDSEALIYLKRTMLNVEIVNDSNYLIIPITDARLRIWLERKMATLSLNSGESIRRDLFKISPYSLLKLLQNTNNILSPSESLDILSVDFKEMEWFKLATKKWKKGISWEQAIKEVGLNVIANSVSTGLTLFNTAICQIV